MREFPVLSKHISILFLIAGLFTGCNRGCDIPCVDINWCCGRPDVMMSWETCVIDYNDCFEEYDLTEYGYGNLYEKLELTPDLFDPYQPIVPDYKFSKGDILQVAVFGEDETFVSGAVVAPDGKLYYSVLDGIQADGKSPKEVSKELQLSLDELFVDPIVTIVPKEVVGPAYRILGRVRVPGEYKIEGPITVREAIAQAGGLFSEADKDTGDHPGRATIPYTDLDKSLMMRGNKQVDINFYDLLFSGREDQNIYVKPSDYIYVAGSETKEVFMLGYVNAPQRIPHTMDMTLMTAFASVGGWPTPNPYSPDLHRIVVIRGGLECPQVCVVDVKKILHGKARDLRLEPGDIVYASHKQWRTAREVVHIAVDTFIGAFVGSFGSHYAREHWFDQNLIEVDDGN